MSKIRLWPWSVTEIVHSVRSLSKRSGVFLNIKVAILVGGRSQGTRFDAKEKIVMFSGGPRPSTELTRKSATAERLRYAGSRRKRYVRASRDRGILHASRKVADQILDQSMFESSHSIREWDLSLPHHMSSFIGHGSIKRRSWNSR